MAAIVRDEEGDTPAGGAATGSGEGSSGHEEILAEIERVWAMADTDQGGTIDAQELSGAWRAPLPCKGGKLSPQGNTRVPQSS